VQWKYEYEMWKDDQIFSQQIAGLKETTLEEEI
jgi:hypothetical protein